MSKMFQCYGIGQALVPVLPPPLKFQSAPNSNQTTYEIGQIVYVGTPGSYTFYIYEGTGVWSILAAATGTLDSLTTDDSTVVVPTAGNINLKGTGSTTTIGSGSNATVELTGLTNHAVLVGAGTATITKVGPTATAGQVLQSSGSSADPAFSTTTYPSTVAQGDILIGTATNVIGSLADVATGQVLTSGGVGANPVYTGSPSISGTLTAATGVIITNGNLSLNTAGDKIVIATGSNASVGTSGVMSGTPGAVTVATTASSATAKIFYSRATTGGTPGQVSITAQDGTGFTLTSTGNETSTFNWWIINA